ncbi:MAG: glutathione S-transferase [Hyphomicrobiales bacterium]|jgi:glutathione S-transferase|nr:glutathione S-transferase [Hyphomicrobiales bacterium]
MPLGLIIGNKAYSSWSMRPWILLATLHIPFEETLVNIYDDKGKAKLRKLSPTGKVPVLTDGDVRVWESLAIMEYVAEKFPARDVWPKRKAARAHARALASEMHAGFRDLRIHCPTNFRREPKAREMTPEAMADVARLEAAWAEARDAFGRGGPFLYGKFSAADAMFAPVVNRLHIYDVPVSARTRAYMDAVMALPAWAAWHKDAAKEKWRVEKYDSM